MSENIANTHKVRNSNLELYRVIVMLLIVAHHYVVNSGLIQVMEKNPLAGDSIFLYLFGMWGKIGINCFVLITGYFMCKSSITIRKFLKLILEVLFYNILIYTIFILFGYESFSITGCLKVLFPIRNIATNFTACFLVFYLFIPFLTILVQSLNAKQHRLLIYLCLFVYTILGTIPKCHVIMNYVSWFSVLFIIASYISRYGFFKSVTHKQWGFLTLASCIISMLSVIALLLLPKILNIAYIHPYRFVVDSNVVLALLTAICSFMYFKDLKMKQNYFINTLGASTFGVLLIHANSNTMREWLWCELLNNVGMYDSDLLLLHAVVSVLAIFFVCVLIDYVRIHTIERWIFLFVDKLLLKYNLK